jgi:hypothetical protein
LMPWLQMTAMAAASAGVASRMFICHQRPGWPYPYAA